MPERDLIAHLARFAAALRERGVRVGLSDAIAAAEALTLVDVGDRDEVRRALGVALRIRPADRPAFERAFEELWRAQPRGERGGTTARVQRSRGQALALGLAPADGEPRPGDPSGVALGWSPEPRLKRKPFELCSPAELAEMERLLSRAARRLAARRSRRLVPTRGAGLADLRRSFRRAVGTGGDLFALARRARALETPRLVFLCDTSGSMDPHSRFLLAFAVALRAVARDTEVFAFNTALVRVTSRLAPHLAPARLADRVPDWSGGTRIGECLETFVAEHAARLLGPKTVVIILSDGLDRGEPGRLAAAMRAIHARSRAVLWLNPLAGDPRYEATARGMQAALPYVDHLLPAHDLASLERVLPLLAA